MTRRRTVPTVAAVQSAAQAAVATALPVVALALASFDAAALFAGARALQALFGLR